MFSGFTTHDKSEWRQKYIKNSNYSAHPNVPIDIDFSEIVESKKQ